MLIQKEPNSASVTIDAYQPGEIRISGQNYRQPLLLTSDDIQAFEQAADFGSLKIDQLIPQLPPATEILLIGCGEKQKFLAPAAVKQLNEQGIGLEIIPTHQACHTFQMLTLEERKVCALLFI